jgi:hypothetical protein
MKFFYHDGANWQLLPVSHEAYGRILNYIDKPSTLSFTISTLHYAGMDTYDAAFLESSGALKFVVVVPDTVVGTDLDSNFDTTIKLWLGRIIDIYHEESTVVFQCEELHARWLRRKVPLQDNVISQTTVSAVSATTITLNSSANLADDRGLRIVYQNQGYSTKTDLHTHIASPAEFQYSTGGTHAETGNDENMNTDDSYSNMHRVYDASGDVWVYCQLEFVPSAPPPDLPITVTIKTCFCYNEVLSWIVYPTIQFYNFATSTWDTFETITTTVNDILTHYFSITRNYYNATNNVIRVRVDGGRGQCASVKQSCVYLQYACIQYTPGNSHIDLEYAIDSVSGSVVTLKAGNPVEDLVNAGDNVLILYKESEWVETQLDDYCSSYLDIAATPASTKPTFSEKNYISVEQDIQAIMTRNKWYMYLGRKTTSGPKVALHAFDKVCQVVVKNKTTVGKYPTSPTANDLPELVLTRTDIPSQYLAEIAQAIYEQRNSIAWIPELEIRSLLINEMTGYTDIETVPLIDEDFENFDAEKIRDAHGWNAWTEDTSCFFHSDTHGDSQNDVGHWKDWNEGGTILPVWSFTAHTMVAGEYVEFDFDCVASHVNGGLNLSVQKGAAGAHEYIMFAFVCDDHLLCIDNAGYTEAAVGTTFAGKRVILRYTMVSDTTYKIAYSIDGSAFADTATFSTYVLRQFSLCQATNVGLYGQGSTTGEYIFHHVDLSWTTEETGGDPIYEDVEHDVQVAHDDKFHVGALAHVHACPSTPGGTDYKIDGDYVINEIEWTPENTCKLRFGFSDTEKQSVDEKLNQILERISNEVAE